MSKATRHVLLAALAALPFALGALPAGAAAPDIIDIPGERVFPESLTTASDGSIIIGSMGQKQIYRVKPGAGSAEVWIPAGTEGVNNVLGVLADNRTNSLYVCSDILGPPGAGFIGSAALLRLDARTGSLKGRYAFPTGKAMCNDIAIDADGNVYATDTGNMEIVRLRQGGTALEVWAGADGAFGHKGDVIDGISVLGKRVYANTLVTSKLFMVPIETGGKAGKVTEVELDRAISHPDGMRSFGKGSVLLIEGGEGGRLSKIALSGASGKVTTVKEGWADGPVAVTVVGTTAYVLEGQLAAFLHSSEANSPPLPTRPFKATAVPVGKP